MEDLQKNRFLTEKQEQQLLEAVGLSIDCEKFSMTEWASLPSEDEDDRFFWPDEMAENPDEIFNCGTHFCIAGSLVAKWIQDNKKVPTESNSFLDLSFDILDVTPAQVNAFLVLFVSDEAIEYITAENVVDVIHEFAANGLENLPFKDADD